MSQRVGHCSASSINAIKTCPMKYRLGYVEGIRPAEKSEPLRIGTNYHAGKEVLDSPEGAMSGGTPVTDENRLALALAVATEPYTLPPCGTISAGDWAVEQEVVAALLAGYHWLYCREENPWETVATEREFQLPLVNPDTGRSTPNMILVGRIDRIVRHKTTGQLAIGENKTTKRPIDSGSSYWGRLRLDTQSKLYINAGRDLQQRGECLYAQGEPPISNLLHEVAKRPTIRPKKLTMAESAEFVKTGEYFGVKFDVLDGPDDPGDAYDPPTGRRITVDGVRPEVEPGKKDGTFAIRETPGMFGARLLQDIQDRPDFYYARKEIPFTDAELGKFRRQIWALQKMMHEFESSGHWYECEGACEATYVCPYTPICYNGVDVSNGYTPPGFTRIRRAEAEQSEVGAE